jgi:ABC-type glycerol-3-phosphate transport system substrate-binding protein
MKKRFIWLFAILVVLSLLLSACGQPTEAPAVEEPAEEAVVEEPAEEEPAEVEPEEVTISWVTGSGWAADEEMGLFLAEFNKEYPHITVVPEGLPINQKYEAIQVRVGGGNSEPDVFDVNGPMTAGYAFNGWLLPLDDVFTADEVAEWNEASLEIAIYDGKLMSAPIHTSTQNLYINLDMFEAAGITPPGPDDRWTWEQVTEAAKKLTVDKDEDGVVDVWGFNFEQTFRFYQLQPLPLSLDCCQSIDVENMRVDGVINSDPWIEAFTWYGSLYNELGVAPQSDVVSRDLFIAEQLAMFMAGPWTVNILGATEDLGFEWGVSPHPYFEGGEVVTPTSGWHLGINANTEHPEEAAAFVHWFMSEKALQAWFTYVWNALSAQPRVNEWLLTAEIYAEHPLNLIRVPIEDLDSNPVVRPPIVGYLEYSQIIETAFSDIRNGADPKEALDIAAQRIESELAKYAP